MNKLFQGLERRWRVGDELSGKNTNLLYEKVSRNLIEKEQDTYELSRLLSEARRRPRWC
jgi:hypothetical protein